jgi:hypothetical protein
VLGPCVRDGDFLTYDVVSISTNQHHLWTTTTYALLSSGTSFSTTRKATGLIEIGRAVA